MLASCWWYQPPPSPSGTGSDSGTLLGSRGCLFISTTSERFFFNCFIVSPLEPNKFCSIVFQHGWRFLVSMAHCHARGSLQTFDVWWISTLPSALSQPSIFFFLCISLSDCVIFLKSLYFSVLFCFVFFIFWVGFFVHKQVVYVLKDTVNTLVIILQNERLFHCRDSWSTLLWICRKWAVCEF